MRLRNALLTTPLAVIALLGAGCGAARTTGGAAAPAGRDAGAILSSIKPAAQDGPQNIAVDLTVGLKGKLKDPTAALMLGSGPISMDLAGPVDAARKAADLTFAVKAGTLDLSGGVRVAGDTGYLRLGDKWYALPQGSVSAGAGGTSTGADPAKIIEAIGDPAALLKDATVVGTEDVDGIATDHVAGNVDTTQILRIVGRLAGSVNAGASPIDPQQIADAAAKLGQAIKRARVDAWIGSADKQVHKITIDTEIVFDAKTKASSGLDGLTATLSVTSTPTTSPDVVAPAGALPAEQLSKDLGALLLSGLGAPTP
jgi:hypothetical protein